MKNNPQVFIEDLEETILRLHTHMRQQEEQYDQFKKVKKFFSKTGLKLYDKKLQQEIEAKRGYDYYQGKFYAYYWVLENFNSDVIPILKRLRGIEMTGNMVWERKAHYSGITGHFDTDEYLAKKKAIK